MIYDFDKDIYINYRYPCSIHNLDIIPVPAVPV